MIKRNWSCTRKINKLLSISISEYLRRDWQNARPRPLQEYEREEIDSSCGDITTDTRDEKVVLGEIADSTDINTDMTDDKDDIGETDDSSADTNTDKMYQLVLADAKIQTENNDQPKCYERTEVIRLT